MIAIKESKTADTRSCDFTTVSKKTLRDSSVQHIKDVAQGIEFFGNLLEKRSGLHDSDKLSDIDGFHSDFVTGFKVTTW